MKIGVQIIKENWMEVMVRQAEESLRKLTIRKPVIKHIPITVWTEIKSFDSLSGWDGWSRSNLYKVKVRNQGGRTYLVTNNLLKKAS